MAELYLIEFKGSRKEYYFNKFYHNLLITDFVITQADRGEDLGRVLKKIEIEVSFSDSNRPRSILRKANKEDYEKFESLKDRDLGYKNDIVKMIRRHGLVMKVVDVETQHDGNKMTIFFTADHRVDFRELVKELASTYKTRIELKQIGVRDEARRIGGYGICGKEQCCNTFIKNFEPISTQHAREQDLPMNPAKISGNCGRLLCCLKYEVGMYKKVKKKFPQPGKRVTTKVGDGIIERIDYFREEAIIRGENHQIIRAKLEDILKSEHTFTKVKSSESEAYKKELEVPDADLSSLDDLDDNSEVN